MPLTEAQRTTLRNDILADGTLNTLPPNSDSAFEIARVYNLEATPEYWVWKTRLSKREVTSARSPDNTVFSFTALISRSDGERDGWKELWNSTLECDPSQENVRQGFADVFSGGTGSAQRQHLLAMARRKASRVEKLLATGTGSTGSPATMGYEGPMPYSDVMVAMGW